MVLSAGDAVGVVAYGRPMRNLTNFGTGRKKDMESPNDPKECRDTAAGIGAAHGAWIGTTLGVVLSAITQNPVWVAIGVALGVGLGAVVGTVLQADRK